MSMLKLPCIDNTEIKYESAEHLDQVMLKACQQHLDMIDEELLDFEMRYAKEDLKILAHDTAWHDTSFKIFKNTILLHKNDDDAAVSHWSERQSYNLWYILRSTLKIVLPMISLSASDHKKKAYNIPALQNAAKAVIFDFFDEDGPVYADLYIPTSPTSSPPTSPSSNS